MTLRKYKRKFSILLRSGKRKKRKVSGNRQGPPFQTLHIIVRYIRHKMQKGFLARDDVPEDDEMEVRAIAQCRDLV